MGVSRRKFLGTSMAAIVAPLCPGTGSKQVRSVVVHDNPYCSAKADVKTIPEGVALMGGRPHTITYGPCGGELIIRAK